jgi:hypothetical protein
MHAGRNTIWVDLLQMIKKPQVPEPLKPVNDILM